jgi:hypothetical protein
MRNHKIAATLDFETFTLLREAVFRRQSMNYSICIRELLSERLHEVFPPEERARILCSPMSYKDPL